MQKVKIDNNAFVYPMPMTLVGALVDSKPNFMPAAWVSRVNYKPPLIAVALGKTHHTNKGIHASGLFSVNVPGIELIKKTDYCGLVSGDKIDKSQIFDVWYGDNNVPMIKECAVCMECKVVNTVDMEIDTLFIGEIVGAYSDEKYLSNGRPDIEKIKPFCLTMPDNNYWALGTYLGKAWGIGKDLIK
ncbi:MAG: flavin reductase family protein [Candidatus Omnitrophica bacterium]|nr:flavin reductase family protein [Candidatus Omnitrophota bacterium]